jgi:hypothetical protein
MEGPGGYPTMCQSPLKDTLQGLRIVVIGSKMHRWGCLQGSTGGQSCKLPSLFQGMWPENTFDIALWNETQ